MSNLAYAINKQGSIKVKKQKMIFYPNFGHFLIVHDPPECFFLDKNNFSLKLDTCYYVDEFYDNPSRIKLFFFFFFPI